MNSDLQQLFFEDVLLLARDCGAQSTGSRLERLLHAAQSLGLNEHELLDDLERQVMQRVLFLCVGGVESGFSYRERKRRIADRIQRLLGGNPRVTVSDDVVSRLTKIACRVSFAGRGPRETVSSLDSVVLNDLLRMQGHRCAVCGIPLSENVRKEDSHFPMSVEIVGERTLEHVLPFMLFGNKTRFEVLCSYCNACKKERMGWHEDGPVVAGNVPLSALRPEVGRRVRFWTLYRTRRCNAEGCDVTSAQSVLYAMEKTVVPGAFGLMSVSCSGHASPSAKWLHADKIALMSDVDGEATGEEDT